MKWAVHHQIRVSMALLNRDLSTGGQCANDNDVASIHANNCQDILNIEFHYRTRRKWCAYLVENYSYKDSKVRSHWVISAHLLYGRNTERNELNPQSQSALGQGLLWTTQWYYGNLLCGWRRGFTNLQLQSQPLRPRCLLWYIFSVL